MVKERASTIIVVFIAALLLPLSQVALGKETGYLMVPPCAFRPERGGYSFDNSGFALFQLDGMSDWFYAPVFLPQGAVITELRMHYLDNSSSNIVLYVMRRGGHGSSSVEASCSSTGEGAENYGDAIEPVSNAHPIDNSRYRYYLYLYLPNTLLYLYEVRITYNY